MNTELVTTEPGTVVLSRREVARFEPNEEQRRMIRATYANGASDDEFQVLMEIARARNLNPLLRQIHFVSRWQPGGNVWAPQVSIDGLRAIAERTGLYAGQDKPVYTENPDGSLLCCEVAVYRKDWTRPVWGVAYWNEYVQMTRDRTTGKERPAAMWAKMPRVMLAKVAESIALRKAFPEDAGGLYTDDEMGQADNGRPEHGGAEEPKVTARAQSKRALPPTVEAPQLGAPSEDVVVDTTRPPDPRPDAAKAAIPAELAAFHAALPSLVDADAAVALWLAHRPALNAAEKGDREAAWNELVKRTIKFGGGTGSATAAKNHIKAAIAAHDATAKAAEAPAAPAQAAPAEPAAVDPAPAAEPEVPAPAESPAEAQLSPVAAFLAAVAAIELPGEGVAAWMKHRAELAPLPVADREGAWKALVARVEVVGRMTNAGPWLKKAVQTADAETQAAAAAASSEPAGLPADVMEGLLADIGLARDATVLASVWAAVAEKEWHDATPAQRVKLETARTAREKALRNPPQPPKGTRARTAGPAADANGTGERSANDSTGAPAMRHVVLDTDLVEVAGTWRETPDGWRAHLAAMTARAHVENSVRANGAALGPAYVEAAAARVVEIECARLAMMPRAVGGAAPRKPTVIGVTQTLERLALDASRARASAARRAAEESQAA